MINYINGDEALFEDASLPRDSFGFKISNGVNTRKQDWKTANSGIAMAQYCVVGLDSCKGQGMVSYRTSKLKKQYNTSDIPSVSLLSPLSSSDITKFGLQKVENTQESVANAKATINSDGDIEILKSGTYIAQATCTFLRPTNYSPATSYYRKEYIALLYKDKSSDFAPIVETQSRACASVDCVTVTHVGWLQAGTILNCGYTHTFSNNASNPEEFYTCVVEPCVNLYRLS